MRLLVTGGAGYVGSVSARTLMAAGHDVVVLDDLSRGHRAAVPDGAELIECNLLDLDSLTTALSGGFDGVLHCAAFALVGESVSQPELYWRNNITGSLNLLDAMRANGVKSLVFSSTCACYGEPEVVPIAEDCPTRPVNPYGESKLAVDRMITAEAAAHGLGAISLRYFNVAGASGPCGEDHEPETHLIPNILRAAQGRLTHVSIFGTDYPTPDGTAVRDYIHVEDLALAHQLALEKTTPGEHRILNLGNGNGFSVREVIEAARRVTGLEIPVVEAPRREGDPPMLVAASAKIRAELGWEPKHPELDSMIADAWAFATARPGGYSEPPAA
ncbi:MAG: UDP-glucose 4-epimerase GalE [Solirubrobacterales bacterium]|jgi:UDP-glucose 4-epimerase|nr:UDP-glucose 4-epimerase GalE [Solirubrobacterales bacterium]